MENTWHLIAINTINGEKCSIGIVNVSPEPDLLPMPPVKWMRKEEIIKTFPDTGWGENTMLWLPEKNGWIKTA